MRVSDLKRSVNFYRDVFECHVAPHEADGALLLTSDGFQLYFRAHEASRARGIDDVGVEQIIWSAGSEAELHRIEKRLRTQYPSTYTNSLNGIIFVDGIDPDGNRVLRTYPTPQQFPREMIDRRFRCPATMSWSATARQEHHQSLTACRRCRNPVARTARRAIAARTSASVPTTRTFSRALVTAV